ncbi:hypothetical protein KUTeg_013981 [Tegillarca granosa]|uniref:Uncharacterized protein n=1 Tax=Tegillarca granosa TaxID=220873 RepID=A0ABQ9EYP3_TEGGR|nr:hypothetical protein KUTeg_013981 [Tegillarca granosa]
MKHTTSANMAEDVNSPKKIKVTAIGDSGVGKTCMLMTYATKTFPDSESAPQLYENSTLKAGRSNSFEVPISLQFQGVTYQLGLTDTIGGDEYRQLRGIFTAGTDVFVVCFSVTEPETLENVKQSWVTEIKLLSPKASFVLVGTKTDLREDSDTISKLKEKNTKPVSIQDGIKTAKSLGAKTYVECSALNMVGLKEVFETVVLVATNKTFTRSKRDSTREGVKDGVNSNSSNAICAIS